MSHTMNIQIELNDCDALITACERLNIKVEKGKHQLHQTTEEGLAVYLPNWKYPAIVKSNGSVAYDNYNGAWGDMKELSKLQAYYGVEKAKTEARKKGYSVFETFNPRTQEVELRIKVGG